GRRSSVLKKTTEGRVILPSSSSSSGSTPGRHQPTVELEVPKSMPRALAGSGWFMARRFRKNGRAFYASPRARARAIVGWSDGGVLGWEGEAEDVVWSRKWVSRVRLESPHASAPAALTGLCAALLAGRRGPCRLRQSGVRCRWRGLLATARAGRPAGGQRDRHAAVF